MSGPSSDRNMFAGLLALQLSMISDQQLLAAMKAWSFEKHRPLEDILLSQQAIDGESRDLIRQLIGKKQSNLSSQANSESELKSLATLYAALSQLSQVADADVTKSLSVVQPANPRSESAEQSQSSEPDPDVTQTYAARTLAGRYSILHPLAAGGIGQVSVADDLELHRQVAVKEIQPKYLTSADQRSRFLKEAEITGRLEHPGVVPVYSLGKSKEGTPFYAMQLVRGVSMADAIRAVHSTREPLTSHSKAVEVRKLVTRLIDACNAVQYAHSKGVLHRDIKPGNIMLGEFGETFVVDWGLARTPNRDTPVDEADDVSMLIPSEDSDSAPTRQGTAIGTPEYMSPEQAAGRLAEIGPASDVFSLGATLYCILTGKHPTSERENYGRSLDYGQFLTPLELNRDVPRALSAICMKALRTEVCERYATALELGNDLEAWLADEPVKAYTEPWLDQARRWLREHQTLATTLAGIGATAVLALVVLLGLESSHNRELTKANQQITQGNIELNQVNEKLTAANTEITKSNQELVLARDEAIGNLKAARQMAVNQLRAAEETLSQPQLPPKRVLALRQLLSEGVFDKYKIWYESHPEDSELANEFAYTARVLSNLYRSQSNFSEARKLIEASIGAQRKIAANTLTIEQKLAFALTLIDQSEIYSLQGKLQNALDTSDESLQLLAEAEMGKAEPYSALRTKSTIEFQRSIILFNMAEYERAASELRSSRDGFKSILASKVSSATDVVLYLMTVLAEVRIAGITEDPSKAIEIADSAIELTKGYAQKVTNRDIQYALQMMVNYSCKYRLKAEVDMAKVEAMLTESQEQLKNELKNGASKSFLEAYCINLRLLSFLRQKQGDSAASLRLIEEAKNYSKQLVDNLRIPDLLLLYAETLYEESALQDSLGRSELCEELRNESLALLKRTVDEHRECRFIRERLMEIENSRNP